MKPKRTIVLALVLVIAGGGSFAATLAFRTAATGVPATTAPAAAGDPVLRWLDVPEKDRVEIAVLDPTFADDLRKLRVDLASRRETLASALTKPDTPDDELRADSEAVLAASNALERRVTRYLLTIRHHLSTSQQQRLFGLCAQGLRQGPGWRNGSGGGMGPGPHGPGGGGGMGPGVGGGRGNRFGRQE